MKINVLSMGIRVYCKLLFRTHTVRIASARVLFLLRRCASQRRPSKFCSVWNFVQCDCCIEQIYRATIEHRPLSCFSFAWNDLNHIYMIEKCSALCDLVWLAIQLCFLSRDVSTRESLLQLDEQRVPLFKNENFIKSMRFFSKSSL